MKDNVMRQPSPPCREGTRKKKQGGDEKKEAREGTKERSREGMKIPPATTE